MAHEPQQREAQHILSVYGPDNGQKVLELLERQFTVLTSRTQVLLALCGIVVSTTGFSGRLIAATNALAQALVIGGVALVLVAAVVVCLGVLHLRWLTQHPGEVTEAWLMAALTYRDRKTTYYRVAVAVLMVGLVLYVGAIVVMLLYPDAAPAQVGVR